MDQQNYFNNRIIGTGIEGRSQNQFAQPRGICYDNETKEIFITDCNNHRVQVYHYDSLAFIKQIGKGIQGSGIGYLNYSVGMCLDNNNNIYVADTNNHRVVVFNRLNGEYVRSIGGIQGNSNGQFSSPYGVCVDHETSILYVADYDNHRIQLFNKDTGTFIKSIGNSKGNSIESFDQPIVVCIDYDTNYLYVADYSNNRVQILNKLTGEYINQIKSNGLSGPRGLCISSHYLFISDRENHRIQVYDKNTLEFVRYITCDFNRPMELCSNPYDGTLLVVDGYNHRVKIIEIPELQSCKIKSKHKATLIENITNHKKSNYPISKTMKNIIIDMKVSYFIKDNYINLDFRELGYLFNISMVSNNEVDSYIKDMCTLKPITNDFIEINLTDKDKQLDMQANMFLNMMLDVKTSGKPLVLYLSLLQALDSLLQSNWNPVSISNEYIDLLIYILMNINDITTDHSMVTSITNSITTIISLYIKLNKADNLNYVLLNCNKLMKSKATDMFISLNQHNWSNYFNMIMKLININANNNLLNYYNNYKEITSLLFGIDISNDLCNVDSKANKIVKFNESIIDTFECLYIVREHINISNNKTLLQCNYQLLTNAVHYIKESNSYNSDKKIQSYNLYRGQRRIWNQYDILHIGDLVDCMDKEKSWFESYIVDIYSDQSMKIHFMGWGSKWDDIILSSEISTRIAPLNTKTKNWRSELFQGGLIEIKCNDDTVNQKWMWGTILTINTKEEWVDVAYSFSNEATIIKRANLYGENICPVGMHTKDKSKVAAANIIKPAKKVEEILNSKNNSNLADDILYLDSEDDCNDIDNKVEMVLPGTSLRKTQLDSNEFNTLVSNGFITVSLYLFETIVKVILDSIESDLNYDNSNEPVHILTMQFINLLFQSSYHKPIINLFLRPLIVRYGIKSKLTLDSSFFSNDLNNLTHGNHFIDVFFRIVTALKSSYTQSNFQINRYYSNHLSKAIIAHINKKLYTSIYLNMLNNMIDKYILKAELSGLLYQIIVSDGLNNVSNHLKQISRVIIDVIYTIGSFNHIILLHNQLVKIVSDYLVKIIKDYKMPLPKSDISCIGIFSLLLNSYNHCRSILSNHFIELKTYKYICDIAIAQVVTSLSKEVISWVIRGFAIQLNNLLRSCNFDCMDPQDNKKHIANLNELVDFFQIFQNEFIINEYVNVYEPLMVNRILFKQFSSLEIEINLLENLLPVTTNGLKFLKDIQDNSNINQKFLTFLLDNLNDSKSNSLSELSWIFPNNIDICTIKYNHLTKDISNNLLYNVKLPSCLQKIQSEFNNFHSHINSHSASSRKLQWCIGYGSLTIKSFIKNPKNYNPKSFIEVDLIVNELDGIILLLFSNHNVISIGDIIKATNLSYDQIIDTVHNLKYNNINLLIHINHNYVQLNPLYLSGEIIDDNFSNNNWSITLTRKVDMNVFKSSYLWNRDQLDSAILYILKKSANLMTIDDIINTIDKEKRSKYNWTYSKINSQCDCLYNRGVIDCVLIDNKSTVYSYFTGNDIHSKNNCNDDHLRVLQNFKSVLEINITDNSNLNNSLDTIGTNESKEDLIMIPPNQIVLHEYINNDKFISKFMNWILNQSITPLCQYDDVNYKITNIVECFYHNVIRFVIPYIQLTVQQLMALERDFDSYYNDNIGKHSISSSSIYQLILENIKYHSDSYDSLMISEIIYFVLPFETKRIINRSFESLVVHSISFPDENIMSLPNHWNDQFLIREEITEDQTTNNLPLDLIHSILFDHTDNLVSRLGDSSNNKEEDIDNDNECKDDSSYTSSNLVDAISLHQFVDKLLTMKLLSIVLDKSSTSTAKRPSKTNQTNLTRLDRRKFHSKSKIRIVNMKSSRNNESYKWSKSLNTLISNDIFQSNDVVIPMKGKTNPLKINNSIVVHSSFSNQPSNDSNIDKLVNDTSLFNNFIYYINYVNIKLVNYLSDDVPVNIDISKDQYTSYILLISDYIISRNKNLSMIKFSCNTWINEWLNCKSVTLTSLFHLIFDKIDNFKSNIDNSDDKVNINDHKVIGCNTSFNANKIHEYIKFFNYKKTEIKDMDLNCDLNNYNSSDYVSCYLELLMKVENIFYLLKEMLICLDPDVIINLLLYYHWSVNDLMNDLIIVLSNDYSVYKNCDSRCVITYHLLNLYSTVHKLEKNQSTSSGHRCMICKNTNVLNDLYRLSCQDHWFCKPCLTKKLSNYQCLYCSHIQNVDECCAIINGVIYECIFDINERIKYFNREMERLTYVYINFVKYFNSISLKSSNTPCPNTQNKLPNYSLKSEFQSILDSIQVLIKESQDTINNIPYYLSNNSSLISNSLDNIWLSNAPSSSCSNCLFTNHSNNHQYYKFLTKRINYFKILSSSCSVVINSPYSYMIELLGSKIKLIYRNMRDVWLIPSTSPSDSQMNELFTQLYDLTNRFNVIPTIQTLNLMIPSDSKKYAYLSIPLTILLLTNNSYLNFAELIISYLSESIDSNIYERVLFGIIDYESINRNLQSTIRLKDKYDCLDDCIQSLNHCFQSTSTSSNLLIILSNINIQLLINKSSNLSDKLMESLYNQLLDMLNKYILLDVFDINISILISIYFLLKAHNAIIHSNNVNRFLHVTNTYSCFDDRWSRICTQIICYIFGIKFMEISLTNNYNNVIINISNQLNRFINKQIILNSNELILIVKTINMLINQHIDEFTIKLLIKLFIDMIELGIDIDISIILISTIDKLIIYSSTKLVMNYNNGIVYKIARTFIDMINYDHCLIVTIERLLHNIYDNLTIDVKSISINDPNSIEGLDSDLSKLIDKISMDTNEYCQIIETVISITSLLFSITCGKKLDKAKSVDELIKFYLINQMIGYDNTIKSLQLLVNSTKLS